MSMGIISGVVGVVGAGASAYAASQGGGGDAMPMLTPRQSVLSYIRGVTAGMPSLYGTESTWRPQFGELNLADQGQYLQGLLGMGGQANAAAGQQLQQARQQEYANMLGNSGSVLELLGRISPNGQLAANQSAQMATDAYNRALGPLSFQEQRASDQQSREAFSARGRLNDNASVASEILGREDVRAAKRQEATNMLGQSFGMNQAYSSPALSMLMQTPANLALGQDYLARSQGIIGQNTPQLINPDAGINMGMQQNANIASYNQSQAALNAAQSAQWGDIGSSLMGLSGSLYQNR